MEKKWESKDSKISRISTLLETETLNLTKNISNWQKYLETAAKFYKYTFTDQVLLSAQAPNATQCATFNQWTETVGRGIRQGSKGIPLLEEKDGRKDIKYVFDISATYISKRSRNVKLWDMNAAEPIAERLSEAYRYDKNTFYGIISQRADEILKTNIKKYLGELTNKKENSLLEELDEPHIEVRFAKIVKESLMFSILTRCGLEAELDEEIMWHMGDFNTIPVISQLGAAVSEISSTILREIEREVRAYNRSQNTEELSGIAEKQTGSAGLFLGNEKENNYEQRENYQRNAAHLQRNGTEVSADVRGGEQSDIQTGQRNNDIPSSVENRRGDTLRPDYVGETQTGIPERGKAGDISGTYDKRSVGTSGGNGQSSKRDGGQAFGGDEQSRGNNGRTESQRPNEVGRAPQRSEKQSKGNSVQRTDIHLNSRQEAEDKSPAFFDTEKNQNSIIGNTPYRSISDKVYRKLSVDTAETLIDMLGGTDIKYSGRQNNDDTITFTFSKDDIEQADKYISEAKTSNKKGFGKDEVEIAKNTDLVAFLSSRGEHLKKVGREYTLAEHDSMRINGNQFYWNSRNVGGNAVSFCMEYYGMDFKSAVAQLLQFNGYNVELQNNNRQSTTVQKEEPRETEEHKPLLNPLDDKTNRVYAYLTKTRGISEDTVKRFLDEGIIKQDIKGNAVFLTFDKDNNLSGAELSGTLSDKKYKNSTERNGNGFTINPTGDNKPEKVMFFESAIDALSYYDMHKDTTALLVSMAGLKDVVVLNTLEKYDISYENAVISSDNDEAGKSFTEKMKNNYGISAYSLVDDELYKICGSESHKDWNDLLISYNEQQLTHTNELIKGIPKDIVIKALQRGTGFVGGKFRMEELYNTESEQKYRIAAIKKEYGTGGFAGGDKTIGEISEMEYSTKGCTIHWEGKSGTTSGNLSWSDMDNVLKEIISNGLYITDEERNKYERSVFIREKVKLLHDGDIISVNGEKFTYKSRDEHNIIVVPDSSDSHIADYNEYYKNYMIGFYKLEKYDFEVLTEERAKEPNGHDQGDIIGNTPYKYVPKKKYRKLDLSAGLEISKKFDENGIKYSGRINDDNTLTLTFDGNRIDDVEKIINSLKPKEKATEETGFTVLQQPDVEANKQEVIDSENTAKAPTEEEVLFGQADLAKFLAERTPSSDEWEDMAYPMFENGYLNTHKPSDKTIFSYNLNEPELFVLAQRYHDGEDIRRELALGLLDSGTVDDIEFVFEDGIISNHTYYYADELHHSLHIEKTEDGFQCSFSGMERFVSFDDIGQAFLDRIHEEFEDLMYWRVLDYIKDDIPDISDETVGQLITAFDGAALPDWEKGDNQPKINRIKKALFDILGDEEQTEKAFACIARQKYNVTFEPKTIAYENSLTDDKVLQAIKDKKDIRLEKISKSSEQITIISNAREKEIFNERLSYNADGDIVHLGDMEKESGLILYNYKNTDAEEILKDLKDKGYTVSGIEESEISIDNMTETINFYRIGDFYEAYGAEAEKAAEVLDLHTATKNGEPMVGIPQHIAEEYSQKLKENGYSVNLSEETKLAAETKKSHLMFGLFGNGITVCDTSKTDILTNDYPNVAHISNEGTVKYYGNTISDTDKKLIQAHADAQRSEFMKEWNRYSVEKKYDILLSRCNTSQFLEITKTKAELSLSVEQTIDRFFDEIILQEPEREQKISPIIAETETTVSEQAENNSVQVELNLSEVKNISQQVEQALIETENNFSEISTRKAANFRITNLELGYGGQKEKYHMNIDAIKTLYTVESENRQATPQEQEILSKFVGWGGLPEVFDPNKQNWSEEYEELKALLPEKEYNAARASTMNAHYTSPTVINAIYKALSDMGFKGGRILEPSMGVGNFFGLLPEDMSSSKLYGVELDNITGRIAKQLYPNANIQVKGFEDTSFRSNSFDAAVGNVPFGTYSIYDSEFRSSSLIHDYFFKKALDKVRPGGIIAFITSKGTLDKQDNSVRKYIAERAELLGAIRLPDNAFQKNANTEVTTDIIFLQKRDRIIDFSKDEMPDWVDVTEANQYLNVDDDKDTHYINNYFIENPNMILGNLEVTSGRFGPELRCKAYEGVELSELLDDAVSKIKGEITNDYIHTEEPIQHTDIIADNYRNFCYSVIDNEIYFRENNQMIKQSFSGKTAERVKGLVNISNILQELVTMQKENYPDENISKQQHRLNEAYDSFTKEFGLITSRQNRSAFREDDTAELLASLENINDKGELISKADIFTKRTIFPYVPVTSVDTASEALAVSISEKAKIDLDFMSQLCAKNIDEITEELKGVIFENPVTKQYETAEEYLSGNVRKKLQAAEMYAAQDEKYNINVEYLKDIQPEPLKASEISAQLGSRWIPVHYFEQFMYELLDTPERCKSGYLFRDADKNPFTSGSQGDSQTITISYDNNTSTYGISNKSSRRADCNGVKAVNTFGTKRMNAYQIMEYTLNMQPVKVMDYHMDADGKKYAVLNQKETLLAQEKQNLIKSRFKEWVFDDHERTEELCKIYNKKFNSTRPREYDGKHLTFGGINPLITLREHQRNAIAHTIYGENTLLAHSVGAGKTFEMVASAMESKRLGLCTKSLICVPKHIVNQFAKEFMQLYPTANILVPDEKDFSKANRERFCSRIATGNYDAIILSHTQLEKIPLSVEKQLEYIQREIDDIVRGIENAKAEKGNFTVKQLEATKKNLEEKLKRLNNDEKRDSTITFEELGVDRLYVDEAHLFKNRFFVTKMGSSVAGINASSVSQRATDLDMKIRYLDEITGSRGTTFATGTPTATLYTLLKHAALACFKICQMLNLISIPVSSET